MPCLLSSQGLCTYHSSAWRDHSLDIFLTPFLTSSVLCSKDSFSTRPILTILFNITTEWYSPFPVFLFFFLCNTSPIHHVMYFTYLFGLLSGALPQPHTPSPCNSVWYMEGAQHLSNEWAIYLPWMLCGCLPFGIRISHQLRWWEGYGQISLWSSLVTPRTWAEAASALCRKLQHIFCSMTLTLPITKEVARALMSA